MEKKTILSIKNIIKEYKLNETVKVNAVNGVNLDIIKVEFVAITGRFGLGKPTLMYIMSGFFRNYSCISNKITNGF